MSCSLTFLEAVELYSTHLALEQQARPSTQVGYKSWLRRFNRYLVDRHEAPVPVAAVTVEDVRSYVYSLARSGLRPRTLCGAIHPLRGMFAVLLEQGHVTSNPASRVKLPKKDPVRRQTVSDEELQQLIAGCEREPDGRRRTMLKAILAVLIYGALRHQEVIDLQVADLALKEGKLTVTHGKGNKSRTIYPCEECIQALREWVGVRPKAAHPYLFLVDSRRRVGYEGLSHLVQDAKCLADLRDHDNISPHTMRHAAATRLLRNGADLRSIQEFLGHADLQTTAMYLHTDERQLQKLSQLGAFDGGKTNDTETPSRPSQTRRQRTSGPRPLRRSPRRSG